MLTISWNIMLVTLLVIKVCWKHASFSSINNKDAELTLFPQHFLFYKTLSATVMNKK